MNANSVWAVSLLVVAACGSTVKVQVAQDSSTTSTSSLTAAACTAADLARVTTLELPKPSVVKKTIDLSGGRFVYPPPDSTVPKLRPDAAWTAMQRSTPSATGADLWLGLYGLGEPSQLAWVAIVHHVAVDAAFPTPGAAPGMTEPPMPVCSWAEDATAVNADTGEHLAFTISSTDSAFGFGPTRSTTRMSS